MIHKFTDKFVSAKAETIDWLRQDHPENYFSIVKKTVEIISDGDSHHLPDPNRITEIDHGDYQGTLVYVIAERDYQPNVYWYAMVAYGSCSGCDSLEAIRGYDNAPPTQDQAKEYWTLMLHIVQRIRKMDGGLL